jgi:hypothetical protein
MTVGRIPNIEGGIQPTLLTTTGDIIYASSASNPARLGIGSSAQVLTVASGVPSWATPTSGGMTLISETTASALSSLSFSSIPSTYKQLFLYWEGIYHSDNSTQFGIKFNNSTTEIYWGNILTATGSSLTQTAFAGTTSASSIPAFGKSNNLNPTAEFYFNCRGTLFIDNYSSTTKTKKYSLGFQYYDNAVSIFRNQPIQDCFFNSTSAITSIDIVRIAGTGTFSNITNSTIRLYGLS